MASQFNQTFTGSLGIATAQLFDLNEELARNGLPQTAMQQNQFDERLVQITDNSDQLKTVLVVDDEGIIRFSTSPSLIGISVADRAYFKKGMASDNGTFVVESPIISRATGSYVTPIAWPIGEAGPSRSGVIASSLEEAYFETLLEETRIDQRMVVEVVADDGSVAFSSNKGVERTRWWVEASTSILNAPLATRVATPRSELLDGFALRSLLTAAMAVVLFTSAIVAGLQAQKRLALLTRAFQVSEQAAKKANDAARQFQAVFQNVEDGIVIFDDKASIMDANRRARDLLQVNNIVSAVEIVKSYTELFKLNGRGEESNRVSFKVELPEINDGRDIRCRMDMIETVTGPVYFGVLTDVGAEERLTNTRLRFIESINHELRTPLTSLSGSLDVYLARFGKDLNASGKKLIELAKGNADRLLILVNDILTLHAVDQKGLSISKKEIGADVVLSDAVANLRGYADSFGVNLEIERPVPNVNISADPNRMQQVMGNLISNAIKYSPRGETVMVGASLSENKTVTLWCRDKGPGIPVHSRTSIFERFAPPAHDHERQVTGTGLGLAIARELVERQGGKLLLKTIHTSEAIDDGASGSTFIVKMPAATKLPRVEEEKT
ncbi:ATP-binding protein [Salipiger sp. IMCC34102]|uniref:ATP-binding protein n=1 Tax=Salipiger sp. IMCC34102 TaxID=2510647 RepID=UPI0013ED4BDD|nr:ATP-binding protein [Salipiger sp. IMCC34102]